MQDSSTAAPGRSRQRLLLLLATTAAGIGLSLTLSDDAQASDRDSGLVAGTVATVTNTTEVVTGTVTDTVDAVTAPVRTASTPTPAKPSTSRPDTKPAPKPKPKPRPEPVKRLVGHIIEQSGKALGQVKQVTHAVGGAGAELLPPVVSDPVDQVTDIVDQVIDQTTDSLDDVGDAGNLLPPPTAVLPLLPTNPATLVPAPAPVIRASVVAETPPAPLALLPAATTAPEHDPADHHGHGGPLCGLLSLLGDPNGTASGGALTPARPSTDLSGGEHGDAQRATAPTNPHGTTPGDPWSGPRTASTPANGHARAYTGRTQPPSPPSG